jgi:hypothetical protein
MLENCSKYLEDSFFCGCRFVNNFKHLLFDLLFLKDQSILIPNKICLFRIDVVFIHTTFEKPDDITVIRILGET